MEEVDAKEKKDGCISEEEEEIEVDKMALSS